MAARKAVEQELTREMILDIAKELFVKVGYRHLSIRQIAKALGYSHGSIYYHFKNKAEIYYSLVKQGFEQLSHELDDIIQATGLTDEKKLENILLGYIQFGFRNPSLYEVMFMIRDEEVNGLLQEEPNQVYNKFAKAIHSLSGDQVTIQTVWSVFLSLHGFVSHLIRGEATYEQIEALAKSHVQFLIKGMK